MASRKKGALMKILVACNTIEDEIKAALVRLGLDYQVIWIEGGLHDVPGKLRGRLQEVMDEADGQCDTLIFALGYCGGGMSGLSTRNYTTVAPLADDCLSVLLGSIKARIGFSNPPTFFMTAGWMRHSSNLVDSYNRTAEKYGKVKADRINKMMLNSYNRFGLVDTGCYNLKSAEAKITPLAKAIGLAVEELPGDHSWLDALLTGPWDNASRFLVVPPNSQLNFEEWCQLMDEVGNLAAQGR